MLISSKVYLHDAEMPAEMPAELLADLGAVVRRRVNATCLEVELNSSPKMNVMITRAEAKLFSENVLVISTRDFYWVLRGI